MPGAGPIAYASATDLMGSTSAYLRDPSSTVNSAIATTLLNAASRFIDEKCGRFFYNDGSYLGYLSTRANREVTGTKDFFGKIGTIASVGVGATSMVFTSVAGIEDVIAPAQNDVFYLDIGSGYESVMINGAVTGAAPTFTCPITATLFSHPAGTIATSILIQMAFYENQARSQWVTVPGDGITPGASNYFLWPTSPKPYIQTGATFLAPWQGFDLPLIPVSNTTYLPTPRPGRNTVAMIANWGWPGIPDLIKDLTLKMASRAWLSRAAEWAQTSGDSSIGTVDMSHHFDSRDEALLIESGFVRIAV